MADYKKSLQGYQNRAAGSYFEDLITATCEYYRVIHIAEIEKTPEPIKILARPDQHGRFSACYQKKAQPDFKGTVKGGKSVVFDCKNTFSDRILEHALSDEQRDALINHAVLGADAFVLVSFSFSEFFAVPIIVWIQMKQIFGRKYLKPEDLTEYKVLAVNGIIDFLKIRSL